MANGNGLAQAWQHFDAETKLELAITELDRIYKRLDTLGRESEADHSLMRREMTSAIAAVKADFTERVDLLRREVREGFEKMEQRQNRSVGLLYTMIGGIVVGLVLLVVQLAPH